MKHLTLTALVATLFMTPAQAQPTPLPSIAARVAKTPTSRYNNVVLHVMDSRRKTPWEISDIPYPALKWHKVHPSALAPFQPVVLSSRYSLMQRAFGYTLNRYSGPTGPVF